MNIMTKADQDLREITCDLLVAGSGASGMTAAIVAAKNGLDVLVAEKEPVFGGTTALSGGICGFPTILLVATQGSMTTKRQHSPISGTKLVISSMRTGRKPFSTLALR